MLVRMENTEPMLVVANIDSLKFCHSDQQFQFLIFQPGSQGTTQSATAVDMLPAKDFETAGLTHLESSLISQWEYLDSKQSVSEALLECQIRSSLQSPDTVISMQCVALHSF